jgi:hypothetical protein
MTPKEVDFNILREDWTKYRLPDDIILRIRVPVIKLFEQEGDAGQPRFSAGAQNFVSLLVPESQLKNEGEGEVQVGEITNEQIRNGTDVEFQPISPPDQWQEYRTSDGWIVRLKPEVGRVVRIKTYFAQPQTKHLEPMYWVNIQPVFQVKKA